MGSSEQRRFSVGWVLISYFFICGGIVAASLGLGALEHQGRLVPYVAFAAGGALGGFFAGRASPHRSVLEPALAGALVVGSIVALLAGTAIGPLVYAFAREAVWREALILGGCTFAGGLGGAIVGELTKSGRPSAGRLRWTSMAVLTTAGALFASLILFNVLLVDRALEGRELYARLWRQSPIFERAEVLRAIFSSLASGAVLGGLVTQLAAPTRQLVAAAAGVCLAHGGLILGVLHLSDSLDRDAVIGTVIIAIAGGLLALMAAAIGWLASRSSKR